MIDGVPRSVSDLGPGVGWGVLLGPTRFWSVSQKVREAPSVKHTCIWVAKTRKAIIHIFSKNGVAPCEELLFFLKIVSLCCSVLELAL